MTDKVTPLPDRRPKVTPAPPPSYEPEQSLLGAILVRPEVLPRVTEILKPSHFYAEAHGRIYGAMVDLLNRGEPVDLVTVSALLKDRGKLSEVGGVVFLAGLSEQVGFATNAEYYAHLVLKYAWRREYQQTIGQLQAMEADPASKPDELVTLLSSKLVDLEASCPGNYAEKIKIFSLQDIMAMEFPYKNELIAGGVWPAGTGLMIVGESGAGKSLILNQLAMCLSMGWDFLGRYVPTARRVLIFQAENTLEQEKIRYLKQIQGLGLTCIPPNIGYFPITERLELANPYARKLMVDAIKMHQADAFFIDPLISFHSANENDNGAMRQILDFVTEIMRKTGAGAGVLHHFGKPTENAKVEHRARGASAIRDWCDTMLALTVKKIGAAWRHEMTFVKVRNGRQPKPISLNRDENLIFQVTVEEPKFTPAQVADLVKSKGGRVTGKDNLLLAIQEETECGERAARLYVDAAIEAQTVIEVEGEKAPGKGGPRPKAYTIN